MAGQLPISHLAATELVEFFKGGLKLSAVKEGETVLVYGDSLTPPHYMAAVTGAAMALGATAVQIIMPSTSQAVQPFAAHTKELGESLMAQAWKAADLVVDMTTSAGQLYSKVTTEALRSGTRVLRLNAPIDDLRRMYPKLEIKARVLRSREILLAGKRLRVTSDAGTDLVMDKTGRGVSAQYGMADEPGKWSMWNGGQVACAPLEDSAHGTLVINTGDFMLPFGRHISDPITCIIRNGRIIEIRGTGLDAFLLRDWFESWKDPNAHTLAHIGWGCHDGANWHRPALKWLETGGLMDAESFYGNMQIAFGNNISPTLGGKNYSPAHIDIECRNNSFYVDGQLIVDHGEFALPELRRK